jgi:hypothetical protein
MTSARSHGFRTGVLGAILLSTLVSTLASACFPGSPASAPSASPAATTTPRRLNGAPAPASAPAFGKPVRVGTFDVALAPEASGLAASLANPGVLYVLNDARRTSGVLAVRVDGATIGKITIAGFEGRNPEGLAVGPCAPTGPADTCIYVGDIGDNRAKRREIRILRLVEPILRSGVPPAPAAAEVIRLAYPTGPTDAEAVLVDGDGVPFVVTKAAGDDGTGGARL